MTDYQRILQSFEAYHLKPTTADGIRDRLQVLRPALNDPSLVDMIIGQIETRNLQENQIENLSRRELEVFSLIGLGLNSKQIGRSLDISVATVGTHRKKISRKLKLIGSRKLVSIASNYMEFQLRCNHNCKLYNPLKQKS